MSALDEPPLAAHRAGDPYVQIADGHIHIVMPAPSEFSPMPVQVIRLPFYRNARELAYMLAAAADELEYVPIAERGWGPK